MSYYLEVLQEFEGRICKLNYARPMKKKNPPPVQPKLPLAYNLFVANLSFEARAKDPREFFRTGGSEVVSAEVIFHNNPRRLFGYGFVSFATKKEAEASLSSYQGKEFMLRAIRVARSQRFVKEMNSQYEDTLNCASISHDGSLVAGGFSDSSLKLSFFRLKSVQLCKPFFFIDDKVIAYRSGTWQSLGNE
ncbi:hypothetical protein Nepgr_004084 [Nepenthes gracilis]|uniref:RRM domain-containing protein n=1 Tax=Nepenthes gracilis TaxID=150966 RepID=A0AAD3S0N9_NEPGR|nr:hypothetical protein Nepgr_004084 [Nepenthes gracilis]